jgi:hypothetical protein
MRTAVYCGNQGMCRLSEDTKASVPQTCREAVPEETQVCACFENLGYWPRMRLRPVSACTIDLIFFFGQADGTKLAGGSLNSSQNLRAGRNSSVAVLV